MSHYSKSTTKSDNPTPNNNKRGLSLRTYLSYDDLYIYLPDARRCRRAARAAVRGPGTAVVILRLPSEPPPHTEKVDQGQESVGEYKVGLPCRNSDNRPCYRPGHEHREPPAGYARADVCGGHHGSDHRASDLRSTSEELVNTWCARAVTAQRPIDASTARKRLRSHTAPFSKPREEDLSILLVALSRG